MSARPLTMFRSNLPSWSLSVATGRISLLAKSRAAWRMSSCSSVSEKSIMAANPNCTARLTYLPIEKGPTVSREALIFRRGLSAGELELCCGLLAGLDDDLRDRREADVLTQAVALAERVVDQLFDTGVLGSALAHDGVGECVDRVPGLRLLRRVDRVQDVALRDFHDPTSTC